MRRRSVLAATATALVIPLAAGCARDDGGGEDDGGGGEDDGGDGGDDRGGGGLY